MLCLGDTRDSRLILRHMKVQNIDDQTANFF